MSDRTELLAAIKAKAVLHGDFILSSGQRAEWYVDLRRILLDGRVAPLAGQVMLDLTWDLGYEAVGGLTLGADPVATAMMHAAARRGTPIDAFVVRKKEKDHGTQRRIEGPDVTGRRVLVVEDTSTTGSSAAVRGRGPARGRRRGGRAWPCWSTGGPGTRSPAGAGVPRGLRSVRPRNRLTGAGLALWAPAAPPGLQRPRWPLTLLRPRRARPHGGTGAAGTR